ncbi:hypothetical protein [Candidatus Albibeggiatoa sp. nov. BB20]|uniref:hypothetical protein n=1 Tax=Candidatus Albibeggiatoa sp. nov. BB20 TaxID=3162723 RepID=UPI00336532BD
MRLLQRLSLILGCLLVFNLHAVEPQIAIGDHSVLILQQDGSVVGWGSLEHDQILRNSSFPYNFQLDVQTNIPSPVNIDNVEELFLGIYAYARKQDGTFWHWGHYTYPTRTISDNIYALDPPKPANGDEPSLFVSPVDDSNIRKFKYVYRTRLFLTDKNELWIMSRYSTHFPRPEADSPLELKYAKVTTDVKDFDVTENYLVILKQDGTVWTSGDNENGQLGVGDRVNYNIPQKTNLSNIQQIAAGENYSLALREDGTLWGWGEPAYLGLGLGTTPTTSFILNPASLPIDNVKTMSTDSHTLVLKNDGTVWAWGDNRYGQLGIGSITAASDTNPYASYVTTPVQVPIDDVVAINASSAGFSIALKNDGSIWSWGNNQTGMLGNGTMVSTDTPQPIVSNTLYMPEGFIGDGIDEFVSLLNTHDETVNATCFFYYEDGTALSFPLELLAKQRTTFTVKDKGVAFYRPFAIVIEPEKKITATLAHYAQGNVAMGANFTPITSKKWASSQGFYHHEDKIRNYLVGFNPNNEPVDINLQITGVTEIFPLNVQLRVEPKSRFNVKLQDYLNPTIPEQPIGALVSTNKPIVVGMSHYDDLLDDGTLSIAEPSWGSQRGYVAEGWLSDTGFEVVNLVNPHDTPTEIIFYKSQQYYDAASEFARFELTPYQQAGLVVSAFLPKKQPLSISYSSAQPVVASFNHFDLSGLNGVNFVPNGHTHWEFAEGFRGDNVLEFLLVQRESLVSNSEPLNVKVRLYYYDGQANAELDLVIPANESKATLFLHADNRVRSSPDGVTYSVTLDADLPIIPYFTHYDFNFGGAFALSGTGWNP